MTEEEVVVKNRSLVWHIIHRNFSHRNDLEDLYQEGCIGLLKAVRTFNPEKGILFSTYAGICIYNAIGQYVRRERTISKGGPGHSGKSTPIVTVYLEQPVLDEEDTPTLGDRIPSTFSVEEEALSKISAKEILSRLKKLPRLYKTILKMRARGIPQREIAARLGVSQSWVSRILIRLERHLRVG